MEQKSLRVLETNTTFFSKIATTLTKLLIPTRIGINGILISMKRNNLLKSYDNYAKANNIDDVDTKESLYKKYEDNYALYLEAIDKYILDSVYKKVKNNTATNFEKEALSKYYLIVSLKEKQYIEYKYKKQEYLVRMDFETVNEMKKEAIIEKYNEFYVCKMDSLYKGMLKNYSVQLSDNISSKMEEKNMTYDKIFSALERYIIDILPIKLKTEKEDEYKNIIKEYGRYEETIIGKLDERDEIRKKMTLLGLSRFLFTHSLPLIAAEECYAKLIEDTRGILVADDSKPRQTRTFELISDLIEEYNIKVLSTKVYWDKPEERDSYKKFWDEYKSYEGLEEEERKEKNLVLFLKYDLKSLNKEKDTNKNIIRLYKEKLVELGSMRNLKNTYKAEGNYTKKVTV